MDTSPQSEKLDDATPRATDASDKAPVATIIIGSVLGLIVIGLVVMILLPGLSSTHGDSRRVVCQSDLHQVGLAAVNYAQDHGGNYPNSWETLISSGYGVTPLLLVCPNTSDTPAPGSTPAEWAKNLSAKGSPEQFLTAKTRPSLHVSYIYAGKGLKSSSMEGAVLAYELPGTHGGKYGNVLFADSGVQTFDAQSLTNLIAELQSGHNPPRPEKLHPATSLPVNDKSNQPGTN